MAAAPETTDNTDESTTQTSNEGADVVKTEGNRNFCGKTIMDAENNCSRDTHCPVSYRWYTLPRTNDCWSFAFLTFAVVWLERGLPRWIELL